MTKHKHHHHHRGADEYNPSAGIAALPAVAIFATSSAPRQRPAFGNNSAAENTAPKSAEQVRNTNMPKSAGLKTPLRQFTRPMPGAAYTKAQRDAWGAEQDRLRLERALNKELKPTPAKRPNRAKPVVFDGGSSCFSDLQYSKADGGVYATFANPTVGTWFIPMSAAEARRWSRSDSYGQTFNDLYYGT